MLLRMGVVGGLAYLVLTVGRVVHGVFGDDGVDATVLALAFGFSLDQLFVSYTLFHYNAVPVLASLSFGYLLVDELEATPDPTPTSETLML